MFYWTPEGDFPAFVPSARDNWKKAEHLEKIHVNLRKDAQTPHKKQLIGPGGGANQEPFWL